MADKGLIIFIKKRLETATPPDEIKSSLMKAGFGAMEIENGFKEVEANFKDTHQDIVASNGFLPPLMKKKSESMPNAAFTGFHHSRAGAIFDGRLRRSDFILGFLLYFGKAVVFLTILVYLCFIIRPDIYSAVTTFIGSDTSSGWLIFLPIVMAPLTVMMLSLCARRLHDLDLPGSLSLIFLSFFIPSTNLFATYEVVAMYVIAMLLFILMITKKGMKTPNRYGPPSPIEGSFLKRIINI